MSGYCSTMARSRPANGHTERDPVPDAGSDSARAQATPQDPGGQEYDAIAEQQEARAARARRDRELSPEQRLERLHHLCAQLATITPARPRSGR